MFFLWFFGADIVESFCPVLRSVFRSVSSLVSPLVPPFGSFSRFALRPAFRLVPLFVSPFGRVGLAVRVSRRFVLLFGSEWEFVLFRASVSWRRCGVCRIVDEVGLADGGVWASVRSVWRGVGRVVWRGVGRGVVIVRRRGGAFRIARSLFRADLSGSGGEVINAPFLSARLGGLSDDDGGCHLHVASLCLSY